LILLDTIAVTGGIVLTILVTRVFRARAESQARALLAADGADEPTDEFAAFPCKLGDVLVRRAERDEAWLAGAIVFSEDRPVAVLFIAPEAVQDRAIFARAGRSEVAWLTPISASVGIAGGDPPSTLEHDRVRFDRTRRIPVRVDRLGTGAPEMAGRGVVAEYTGPGTARALVVIVDSRVLAWRGVVLAETDYDVLPGGLPPA
jgi:hypothetical protein